MRAILRCAFAAIAVLLCAQQAAAQSITGCPPGQAMQSSDPSGKRITCVPIPDAGTIQAAIDAEIAARASADQDLRNRIDALTERDIVGKWATTGSTNCIQALNGFTGFNPTLPPVVPFNVISLLTGDFAGTTEFSAGGMGRSVGASHVITSAATVFANGILPPGTPTNGGASVATLDSNFNWTLDTSSGRVTVDHPDPVVQPLTLAAPGQTATIQKVPLQVGYLSKDKRTIMLTHETMTLETSTRNTTPAVTTPRFCSRVRVMTRLN